MSVSPRNRAISLPTVSIDSPLLSTREEKMGPPRSRPRKISERSLREAHLAWDASTAVYAVQDGRRRIVAGTRERLIGVLLGLNEQVSTDDTFTRDFLFTYEYFLSNLELFDELRNYFSQATPRDLQGPALFIFQAGLRATRRRVLEVLGMWFDTRPDAFYDSAGALMNAVLQFSSTASGAVGGDEVSAHLLEDLSRRVVLSRPDVIPPHRSLVVATKADATSVSEDIPDLQRPRLVAEQLTLVVHALCRAIHAKEFLFLGREPKHEELLRVSPNVARALRFSDEVQRWVLSSVLRRSKPADRNLRRDFFLSVAKGCLEYQNIETCRDIVLMLNHTQLTRLPEHAKWKGANDDQYRYCLDVFSDMHYKKVAEMQERASPPMCPVVMAYKYWSTQADMKTPLHHHSNKELLNFEKLRVLGAPLQRFHSYQKGEYLWEVVPHVREFLLNLAHVTLSLDAVEQRSMDLEPLSPELAAALGVVTTVASQRVTR